VGFALRVQQPGGQLLFQVVNLGSTLAVWWTASPIAPTTIESRITTSAFALPTAPTARRPSGGHVGVLDESFHAPRSPTIISSAAAACRDCFQQIAECVSALRRSQCEGAVLPPRQRPSSGEFSGTPQAVDGRCASWVRTTRSITTISRVDGNRRPFPVAVMKGREQPLNGYFRSNGRGGLQHVRQLHQ
jgi:hypothetical protein